MNMLIIWVYVLLICFPSTTQGKGLRFYRNRLNVNANDVVKIPDTYHAVAKNDLIFLAAQKGSPKSHVSINKHCDCSENTKFEQEANSALENLIKTVIAAGGKESDIVFTTNYLKNISNAEKLRGVYCKLFAHFPTQTTVQVTDLPNSSEVAIDGIAVIDPPKRKITVLKSTPEPGQRRGIFHAPRQHPHHRHHPHWPHRPHRRY